MSQPTRAFDSAWLKWAWAVVAGQALAADVKLFASDSERDRRFKVRNDYHPRRHCIAVTVEALPEIPVRWGLRLGDIAHNFRSCLDHLAWALVHRGSRAGRLTAPEMRRVYFPVSKDRLAFNNEIVTMLPGVRRSDITIVRKHQPHTTGSRSALHSFTLLVAMSNEDKHRAIKPIWVIPTGATVSINAERDCVVTRIGRPFSDPIQVGCELVNFYVRKTGPDPDIDVELDLMGQPSIDLRITVLEWLDKCTAATGRLLSEFAPPPAEIDKLGV
ncbi:MAG: hypothetical protein WD646_06165 [Actinomycetota bacterium]